MEFLFPLMWSLRVKLVLKVQNELHRLMLQNKSRKQQQLPAGVLHWKDQHSRKSSPCWCPRGSGRWTPSVRGRKAVRCRQGSSWCPACLWDSLPAGSWRTTETFTACRLRLRAQQPRQQAPPPNPDCPITTKDTHTHLWSSCETLRFWISVG